MSVAAALALLAIVAVAATAGALALNRVALLSPPGFAARLAIYLGENVAQTAAAPRLPELRTRRYVTDAVTLHRAVVAACADLGWQVVLAELPAVRCVVRSRWFGFRDDLDAVVRTLAGKSVALDLRSVSRIGRGDLGANAHHLVRLYMAVERRLRAT